MHASGIVRGCVHEAFEVQPALEFLHLLGSGFRDRFDRYGGTAFRLYDGDVVGTDPLGGVDYLYLVQTDERPDYGEGELRLLRLDVDAERE